jgi:alpha-tubulin suppressor-like RCC1 family protein
MVRIKVVVAAAVGAGVLAGGLAMPPAASADTAQVVYAWGDNSWAKAGVDPGVAGTRLLRPVPVHGSATNVVQLSGSPGTPYVLSLRSDGTVWGWGRQPVTPVSGVTRIAISGSTVLVRADAQLMPNVVGELRASALADLHALGLSVQELSVADNRLCDNVGYVESQSPSPGTVVGPGTHVTIRVYVQPAAGCF